MKCNEKMIIAYINEELSRDLHNEIDLHIKHCHKCNLYYQENIKINTMLSSYSYTEIDRQFLSNILEIEHSTKRKFALLHLFPKEFALSACSILLALLIGAVFSQQTINQRNAYQAQSQDYLDQISLVSLIDY